MWHRAALISALAVSAAAGQVRYDAAGRVWVLESGGMECRVGAGDELVYLGPRGGASWAPRSGTELEPAGQEVDGGAVRIAWKHERLPLHIETTYTARGDTGVFTREAVLTNTGDTALGADSHASLAWNLPAGGYELSYLYGGWGLCQRICDNPDALLRAVGLKVAV